MVLFGKISLRQKASLLDSILKKVPELNKTPQQTLEMKGFIKRLNNIIEKRNIFAHTALYEIDYKKSHKENKTVYKEIHGSSKNKDFNNETYNKFLSDIDFCIFDLITINNIVQTRSVLPKKVK